MCVRPWALLRELETLRHSLCQWVGSALRSPLEPWDKVLGVENPGRLGVWVHVDFQGFQHQPQECIGESGWAGASLSSRLGWLYLTYEP